MPSGEFVPGTGQVGTLRSEAGGRTCYNYDLALDARAGRGVFGDGGDLGDVFKLAGVEAGDGELFGDLLQTFLWGRSHDG